MQLVTNEFWKYIDQLVSETEIYIDRPRGTRHPRYPELTYPLDYGYLVDTSAMDGAGIDVFLGTRPQKSVEAIAITVDLNKRDAEIKLLIGCTPEEEQVISACLNGEAMRAIMIRRNSGA